VAVEKLVVVVATNSELRQNHKQTDDKRSSSHDGSALLMSLPSDGSVQWRRFAVAAGSGLDLRDGRALLPWRSGSRHESGGKYRW
jgi:hypothetical protein